MPLPKLLSQSQGATSSVSWEPTVVYLLLLIIAEMIIFGLISRLLR
jgi:hypothetical protein